MTLRASTHRVVPLAALALLVGTLPGCTAVRQAVGECGTYLASGAIVGGVVGNVGGRAAGAKSTEARAATTAAGAVAGAAVGYAACQKAHRQRRDLEERFAAVEAELAQARADQAASEERMGEMAADMDRMEADMDAMGTELDAARATDAAEPVPGGGAIRTEVVEDRMVRLEISGALVFDSGSATLSPRAKPYLDALAASLVDNPESAVEVQGHTDDVGEADANLSLSERRAEAVAASLRSQGVTAGRLIVTGYGETQPVVPNTTAANRAKNRRVEVWIVPTGS